jgi:Holliday junction resolvase RusA-like endonuclease
MKTSKIFIPVKPVPACRPRVTRFGTYFSKTYTDFRNDTYKFLQKIRSKYPVKENVAFKVEIQFICRRPKNPSNEYPVGDVDNYLKGPLDAITKVEMFWKDDIQVIDLHGTKRYAKSNEEFGMHITIHELDESEAHNLLLPDN